MGVPEPSDLLGWGLECCSIVEEGKRAEGSEGRRVKGEEGPTISIDHMQPGLEGLGR